MEWVRQGGIAVHRNFDVDGMKIGVRVRSGAAFHVLGSREDLIEWGRSYRMSPRWLQDPRSAGLFEGIWHYDVFGAAARRLVREGEAAAVQEPLFG